MCKSALLFSSIFTAIATWLALKLTFLFSHRNEKYSFWTAPLLAVVTVPVPAMHRPSLGGWNQTLSGLKRNIITKQQTQPLGVLCVNKIYSTYSNCGAARILVTVNTYPLTTKSDSSINEVWGWLWILRLHTGCDTPLCLFWEGSHLN